MNRNTLFLFPDKSMMFSAEYMAAAGAGECYHSLKHCHVLRSDSQLDANIHINYCVLFRISAENVFKCTVGNQTKHPRYGFKSIFLYLAKQLLFFH